jgi:hypothetical protein
MLIAPCLLRHQEAVNIAASFILCSHQGAYRYRAFMRRFAGDFAYLLDLDCVAIIKSINRPIIKPVDF